jgi:hypothetical protein
MITVKEAALKAAEFAAGVLDEPRREDLRLEEVEKDGQCWLITLSMPSPLHPLQSAVLQMMDAVRRRDYKTFTVDAETGEVLSMKIRQLAGAA